MPITFSHHGDFSKTKQFFEKLKETVKLGDLNKYGQRGVEALQSATPIRTGKTAASWGYRIKHDSDSSTIEWYNTNVQDGVNIAVIIEYGHGTGWGGYVQGRKYIEPAIQPVFDSIADEAWKEVTRA